MPPINPLTDQLINPRRLARALSTFRRKHRLSINKLSKLSGISRRTLARLESAASHRVPGTRYKARFSSLTLMRLAKLLLPPDQLQAALDDSTRLSRLLARSLGPDPLLHYFDDLYHYPAFLFHDAPSHRALRDEFGPDYRHSLDLLLHSGFTTRNLGARLRAWRLQHDLTLVDVADLLGLSKSELHRIERAERAPSPRTRYRILRLLTATVPAYGSPGIPGGRVGRIKPRASRHLLLPATISSGLLDTPGGSAGTIRHRSTEPGVSHALGGRARTGESAAAEPPASPTASDTVAVSDRAAGSFGLLGGREGTINSSAIDGRSSRAVVSQGREALPTGWVGRCGRTVSSPVQGGWAGTNHSTALLSRHRLVSKGGTASQPGWVGTANDPAASSEKGGRKGTGQPRRCAHRSALLAALKAQLALPPPPPADDPDALHLLRHLWLISDLSTRDLAARLGISQPYLIRLLRGDRRPRPALRDRILELAALTGS